MSVKGKEKANQIDGELLPVITYRHLLSNTPVVFNPMRVVALCDNDAFYAACEQVRLGLDRDIPIVVQQWQSLIAVNYPARKFGITRMESIVEAKKKCPELVAVHTATYKEGESEAQYWDNPDSKTHKVSLDHYRRESMKIMHMYREMMPAGGDTEKASIDEAFLDFTIPVRDILLQQHPHLSDVPAAGLDTPLPPAPPLLSSAFHGTIVPTKTTASLDPTESDETPLDPKDEIEDVTWHDHALAIASELMNEMRTSVNDTLGYTTSAGIARNKMLAKLVASYKKPNAQSILRNAAIPGYLHPMAFQKIRFLGGKLGDAIAEEYGAKFVGDLMSIDLGEMQRRFGEESVWVYNALRGIDYSEVKERTALKSMLASKNLRPPLTTSASVVHWIRIMAGELMNRLTEERETKPNLWPKTLVLHLRQGFEPSRSKQAPFPFAKSFNVDMIAKLGEKLWKELMSAKDPVKVNYLSLGFSGLEAGEAGQRSLEGFFGEGGVKRKREESDEGEEEAQAQARVEDEGDRTSFRCTRCGKRFTLDSSFEVEGEEEMASAMVALRMEHDDFHFAQDLSRQDSAAPSKPVSVDSGRGRGSKKKKKIEVKGIGKYFTVKPKSTG
ncbi:hypothetical protein BOTBODRAFT_153085 [Botryobasidium botryosum FD-172 SS1]|uniref:DNA polymerase eta n=1 Tax=Botryobasidium botryosum (strain FD-172 SS1) TaxID=930990 RepID=A0A067N517_BOTB1|nr:hypothetical protein BOTBODRAFT_153085 [Botryobasidium botryosum FD-172 SS1]